MWETIFYDLEEHPEIFKTVRRHAYQAEESTEEFMKKVWEDLCTNYGLYYVECGDDSMCDENDIKKGWWEEEDCWREEYEDFDSFLEDFSNNDLKGLSHTRTYKLYPEASEPDSGVDDEWYPTYLNFFGQLFDELGLTDMSNDVVKMRDAYKG